jgi:hypothetical protein
MVRDDVSVVVLLNAVVIVGCGGGLRPKFVASRCSPDRVIRSLPRN